MPQLGGRDKYIKIIRKPAFFGQFCSKTGLFQPNLLAAVGSIFIYMLLLCFLVPFSFWVRVAVRRGAMPRVVPCHVETVIGTTRFRVNRMAYCPRGALFMKSSPEPSHGSIHGSLPRVTLWQPICADISVWRGVEPPARFRCTLKRMLRCGRRR